MTTQKPQSMWERYRDRPAARPKMGNGERISSMADMAQEQDRLMGDVMQMLADHANIIDALKAQLKDIQHFMDWATATHENIFKEYKSVHDIGEST